MSSESFNVAMGLAVGYECGFEFVVVDAVEHRAEIGGHTEEAKTPGKRADRVFGVGERVEHGTAREEGERDQAEEEPAHLRARRALQHSLEREISAAGGMRVALGASERAGPTSKDKRRLE